MLPTWMPVAISLPKAATESMVSPVVLLTACHMPFTKARIPFSVLAGAAVVLLTTAMTWVLSDLGSQDEAARAKDSSPGLARRARPGVLLLVRLSPTDKAGESGSILT